MGAAESLSSDRTLCDLVGEAAKKVGLQVRPGMIQSFGSEDLSYMMNKVQENGGQATFMRTLSYQPATAHNRKFDFGEELLVNGVKAFCASVYDIMK